MEALMRHRNPRSLRRHPVELGLTAAQAPVIHRAGRGVLAGHEPATVIVNGSDDSGALVTRTNPPRLLKHLGVRRKLLRRGGLMASNPSRQARAGGRGD